MCNKCAALKNAPVFGSGWHEMATAPKDGSIIEIEVRWGAKPWRGLFLWSQAERNKRALFDERIPGEDCGASGWRGVPDSGRGILTAHAWRPFKGDPGKYTDPYDGFDDFNYVVLGMRPLGKLLAAEARYHFA